MTPNNLESASGPRASARDRAEMFAGLLIGTAVGDALGLPAENLSPQRIERFWKGDWRMRLLPGRGMLSDDTEHTLIVAQALLTHPGDMTKFQTTLAWKLRWWFASLPGGIGLATASACIKLWLGFPPRKAAVRSAGGGPAMRSAIIGAFFADDPQCRHDFVLASSQLTHRSWQSDAAALAVAECAAHASLSTEKPNENFLDQICALSKEPEWGKYITALRDSLKSNLSVRAFAAGIGLEGGVTGYSLHVAIVAIYAWLRGGGDFRASMISVLECGGDTDTAGAIVGAIVGASAGISRMPQEWVKGLFDWPRSPALISAIASRLAEQMETKHPLGPVPYFWPAVPVRNFFFLMIVLMHGFRRLLPPY